MRTILFVANFSQMKIKGTDGHEYNVTGQGQGNFNTVGAAGGIGWIAEKLFGGSILGGNNCQCNCSENMLVNRYELNMQQALAAKDARIGLLESNIYTDQKLADVYDRLLTKINANKEQQDAINMQQAVYNGTNTAAIGCIQSQLQQLYSLTKLVIPNGSVCPGWGNVTVTPATAPTT